MATRHEQVRSHLKQLIETGSVRTGDTLPGEIELSTALAVSRNTVRHALDLLETEYELQRTPGRGTVYVGRRSEHPKVQTIGVVNSTLLVSIYPEMIHGIEDGLYHGGYTMILANGNHDHHKERESIQRMVGQGISGLVIEPTANARLSADDDFVKVLNQLDIPIVTTGCRVDGLHASFFTMDDLWIGRRATEYLLGRGHKRIGFVYINDAQAGVLRYQGYLQALAAAGISPSRQWVRSFSIQDRVAQPGARCTLEILKNERELPSAIIYFNDQTALEAYRVFDDLGLRVPADISIIGVDNIEKTAHVEPALTTFNHPKYLMGTMVAQMMLARVGTGADPMNYGFTVEPELVERASVASIPSVS